MSRTLTLIKPPLFAVIAFALCMLIPAYSHAKETSDAEAQRLKASFQNLLDYQKTVNDALGSVDLVYDGELTITRQPKYYTLTFPHIFIGSKSKAANQASGKQVMDFGVITVNAMADEKPGYWKIVLTFPDKFSAYDALKKAGDPDLFSLTIGEQRSIAQYSEELGYFTKFDMNLSGLDFLVAGQKTGIEIGGMQLYTKLEEKENGKFSGPGHFLLKNLQVAPENQDAEIGMEELKLSFFMGDFVLPTLEEYRQKILKHAKTLKDMQALENQSGNSAQEVSSQKVLDMITDMYDFDMDSLSFAYSAKNVDIKDTPLADCIKQMSEDFCNQNANLPETRTIRIANGRLGAGVTGLKSDNGALRFEFEYEGFKTAPTDPELNDLVPQNVKTKLEAQNVPYKTLSELGSNTMQSIAQNPEGAQMAWFGVLMRLPAIISQAGTQVVMNGNNVSNHIYDVTLNGKIATSMSSMTGFAAKFNLLFEGLESLLSASEKHSTKTNSPHAKEYQQLVPTLRKLKSIGTPTKGKNGKAAYKYDIELGQQGNITINGHDAQAVFAQ